MAKTHVYEVIIGGIKHRIQATEEYAASLGEGAAKKLTDAQAAKPLEVPEAGQPENKEAKAPSNK
ncbi:hypothetical protein KDI99_gp10 [Arthrobacter phage Greenhouse]|uniref:Uncharacterized protein n=6 Tax=Korravirus TaxID=1982076 RepID=A0A1I9SE35_9CAUD|nr:hypothetical protein FDH59_gp10 [Arthrobacter phage Joann]YP_010049930.1 hypothetical protein KDI97_gp10 [Arthrobacter phage GreenHearts]YP_010049992.1 hypothetical protein KDI99_gp10 [Arthrobacter phage Greenhouse]YP_010050301.1 hypothetical protein KDJ04_gp10 [Arthrobacter phage Nubia]YP_010050362.1 hypothetical protein KDJ05_gp10 [Arthrobacter phage Oxynfrius]UYL86737.1 hypothetical protein SEA_ALBANESE_10 [Arthrobacter phage Albanese]WKW85567.1 hypothetical protein SEA_LAKSHMI_10 [Arth